ncbi:hypothetical protein ABGB07_02360 [Micromonosporaceae bacterium B7E4]
MTVAYRSSASTTVGTAGTSVVVPRPTGTAAGDLLVAFIAYTNTPTVTQPAGWTFLATQTASTSVRILAYYRVADSSEPASWTWTIASSQRAVGWVGAYTGVDATDPIVDWVGTADTTAGTAFSSTAVDIIQGAAGVGAVAAVRTASGTATTWLVSGTERADLSTNEGAGTDIAGAVTDTVYVGADPASYGPTWTASQSQTAGAMLAITLRPAFVGLAAGDLPKPIVEAAWGADPDGDPDLWVWTDISAHVKATPGIVITKGLQPDSRASLSPPTSVTLSLLNPDGDYTPDNPLSVNWPNVVADTPLRVSVPYGYAPPTERATVFVESWTPSWDTSTNEAIVEVQAYGRLQRMQTVNAPVMSALRRALSGVLPSSTARAFCYWPCEDEDGAEAAASAFTQLPATASPGVTFAAASDCPGSAPLPTLDAGAMLLAPVPAYTATTQWVGIGVVKMPETPPASTTQLLRVLCTGTAQHWWIEISPGAPDVLHLRAYEDSDSPLLDATASIVEADVFGQWVLLYIAVTQSGANINYRAGYLGVDAGVSVSGTLNNRTIGRGTQVRMAGDAGNAGLAVGHLAFITDPAYDPASDPAAVAFVAIDGRSGDVPYFRFDDLLNEAGVPHDFLADVDLPQLLMGPQTPTTLPGALEECAATDQSLIHDGGPGGSLIMVTRSSRHNNPVQITVDVDSRELAPPFVPTYTTRDRVSDSTVSRTGGSSARYVDTTVRGSRPEQVSYSLHTDQYLYQIAGYRVNLSGTPGMRYPQVAINLRASVDLQPAWLGSRIGSRMQAINLWDSHGPSIVDQHIDGSTERISDRWDVVLHCNPATPFDAPVLEATDDSVFRADLEASTLDAPIGASDTSVSVASAGALISTDAGDYPCDLDLGGEQITADSFGQVLNANAFLRDGGTTGWTGASATIAYDLTHQRHPSWGALLVTPNGVAASGGVTAAARVAVSASTQYRAMCWVYATNSMQLGPAVDWHTAISGSGTSISTGFVGPVTVSAGVWTLLTGVLTSPATAAAAVMRARHANTPAVGDTWWTTGIALIPVSSYDASPQILTVTRGQYARTHDDGTRVVLWRGRGVAL